MNKITSTKKSLNIILRIIVIFVFILSACMVLSTFFATYTDSPSGKEIFGYKLYIVESDSMSKSRNSIDEKIHFNKGDVIFVRGVKAEDTLQIGEVVTFISLNSDSYGKILTHKIRDINYGPSGEVLGYETYGVHTGESDEVMLLPENVIGKYEGKISGVGDFFKFLKTTQGFFISIVTPIALLIILFSIRLGKNIEQKGTAEVMNVEMQTIKDSLAVLEKKLDEVLKNQKSVVVAPRKRSFADKLLKLDGDTRKRFNDIHNAFVEYRNLHDRLSSKGISYRLGKKLVAKMTVRGKTLKLHLALDVEEFNKNVYFQKDMQEVKSYAEVPFTVKLKSNRSLVNALKLVETLMQKNNCAKKKNFAPVNKIKEIRSSKTKLQFNKN